MNWDGLFTAIALVLIIEGILPFTAPSKLRELYQSLSELPDNALRQIGLGSIAAGMVLLMFL